MLVSVVFTQSVFIVEVGPFTEFTLRVLTLLMQLKRPVLIAFEKLLVQDEHWLKLYTDIAKLYCMLCFYMGVQLFPVGKLSMQFTSLVLAEFAI